LRSDDCARTIRDTFLVPFLCKKQQIQGLTGYIHTTIDTSCLQKEGPRPTARELLRWQGNRPMSFDYKIALEWNGRVHYAMLDGLSIHPSMLRRPSRCVGGCFFSNFRNVPPLLGDLWWVAAFPRPGRDGTFHTYIHTYYLQTRPTKRCGVASPATIKPFGVDATL
jgi:hypothetical protein